MVKRSKSSARWLAEHASDEFVKRAHREGWRSRAVFKLAEIQETERLLRPGIRGVDFVLGDFREEAVLNEVLGAVGAAKVDLVLSDMAPNMAGIDAVDQPRS